MHRSLPVNDPPDPETTRLGRTDGCPRCISNVEAPFGVRELGIEHFVAAYHCRTCAHLWFTEWIDD